MKLKFIVAALAICIAIFVAQSVLIVKRRLSLEKTRSELAWMMVAVDKLYSRSNQLPDSKVSLHQSIHLVDERISFKAERLQDFWGHPYEFLVSTNGAETRVLIISNGPDGRRSTGDDLNLEFTFR